MKRKNRCYRCRHIDKYKGPDAPKHLLGFCIEHSREVQDALCGCTVYDDGRVEFQGFGDTVVKPPEAPAATGEPWWFAVTRWSPEDVRVAAEEQGMTLTEEQAVAWWRRNESRFQNRLVEAGNEILSNMDFKED